MVINGEDWAAIADMTVRDENGEKVNDPERMAHMAMLMVSLGLLTIGAALAKTPTAYRHMMVEHVLTVAIEVFADTEQRGAFDADPKELRALIDQMKAAAGEGGKPLDGPLADAQEMRSILKDMGFDVPEAEA